jgi:hypothetical protein
MNRVLGCLDLYPGPALTRMLGVMSGLVAPAAVCLGLWTLLSGEWGGLLWVGGAALSAWLASLCFLKREVRAALAPEEVTPPAKPGEQVSTAWRSRRS